MLETVKDSKDADIQLLLGDAYMRYIQDYSMSKLHYKKAVELGGFEALENLAEIYELEGDFDKAEEYYLKAHEKTGSYYPIMSLVDFYRVHDKSKVKATVDRTATIGQCK